MNNKIIFLPSLCGIGIMFSLLLPSCDRHEIEQINHSQIKDDVNNFSFYKNEKTGLCFAGYTTTIPIIINVPCTSEVEALIVK